MAKIDEQTASLFKALKKNIGSDKEGHDKTFRGDDLSMGSVVKYGVPSGIPEMDLYLGQRGGYPGGKIIEFYGKPMCGKTTAALQAAAEWQKRGGGAMFIDTEMSFDPERALQLGVNTASLTVVAARTIEEIFTTIKDGLKTLKDSKYDKPFLFIVDSVNGAPTQPDVDGDLEKHERVGFEAKMIKRGLKQINPMLDQVGCNPSIIFINHAVTKISAMAFGKKTDSGGGLGIKFYSTVRVEFTGIGTEKMTVGPDKGAKTGQKISVEIVKLKGGSLKYAKFNIVLQNDDGFDKRFSLRSAMVATNFASLPKGSQVITILPGSAMEVQVKTTEWNDWLRDMGGYDKVYLQWRKWAIDQKVLKPWGRTA
jgi:protein RecA